MSLTVGVLGGAWIGAGGYGTLRGRSKPAFLPGLVPLPPHEGLFPKPLARFGRFDEFTRLGAVAAGLALKDAGLAFPLADCGMVVGTRHETARTDAEFNQSSLGEGGLLASPNLFSYTLPVIVLGECAVCFNLTGPTFCVGEEGGRGLQALRAAGDLLVSGKARRVLAGWIDSVKGEDASGACFAVLDTDLNTPAPAAGRLEFPGLRYTPEGGTAHDARSITDLF
jgi:3-oxoacyl-(acyl-carrier-protein) synthase